MTDTPPPDNRPIGAVIFDLGETLLNYHPVEMNRSFYTGTRLAWRYARQVDRAPASFWQYFTYLFLAVRWKYLKSLITGREFDSLELLRRLHRHMNCRLSEPQVIELAWRLYYPLSRAADVDRDAHAVLAGLHERGISLALLSNTFLPAVVLDRHLEEVGLIRYLPSRVYSSETIVRKPDPEVFAIALAKAGLQAAETLYVGDSIRYDVRGAAAAGMRSALKDPLGLGARARPKPTYRIKRLGELLEIVDRVNGPAGG